MSNLEAQPKANGKKRSAKPVIDSEPATFGTKLEMAKQDHPPIWDEKGTLQGRLTGVEDWAIDGRVQRFFLLEITAFGSRYGGPGSEVWIALHPKLRKLIPVAMDPQRIGEIWIQKDPDGSYSVAVNTIPIMRAASS